MKKLFTGVVAALAATAMFTAGATAANPHFINANADIDNDGNLVVSWKEAGLGDNQLIDYTASADSAGFYACINRGNNHPQASNKEAFQGPVSGSGTFASGKNGQITASLTVEPPPSTLDCPGNQRLVLACVSYTNITLADTTTPVTADIPGTVSETLLTNPLLPECAGF
jgi:hypothetical protein